MLSTFIINHAVMDVTKSMTWLVITRKDEYMYIEDKTSEI